jgi:predicted ATP-grasp superfamily ATP-dependent carboligase
LPGKEQQLMRPVIVIGGPAQSVALIRALGMRGVPVVVLRFSHQDFGHGSRWVREVHDCPHPEREPGKFLAALRPLADRMPGAMLFPPSDLALSTITLHRDDLERMGFVVAACDPRVASLCLDKDATYEFARANGVPAPATVTVRGAEDIERFAECIGFPGVLKPTVSHRYKVVFGRKWTRVDTVKDALEHYEEARAAGFEVVLQEFIAGNEACGANYNGYLWDDGGDVGFVDVTAAKIRNSPVETGSPCVVVSEEIPEVIRAGRRLLGALDYRGFANIEFKRDPRDGIYRLIEVNARLNLSAMLAIRCGVDFPWLEYRHRMYGEPPTRADYRLGVHWIDITRDLRAAPAYLRRADYSVRRFLAPYLRRPVFAVASWSDPRPAAIRAVNTLRHIQGTVQAKIRPAGTTSASVAR